MSGINMFTTDAHLWDSFLQSMRRMVGGVMKFEVQSSDMTCIVSIFSQLVPVNGSTATSQSSRTMGKKMWKVYDGI